MPEGLRKKLKRKLEIYRLYCEMTNLVPISRRYFIIGYFDGVLTIQGLIMGAHLSGKATPEVIISAGIATAIALGISSGWGAYEAEGVEQRAMKKRREKAMLRNVGGIVDRAHTFAVYISAIVHAISPIIAACVPLLVYLFLPMDMAFVVALSLGFVQLFAIGAVMGRVADVNVAIAGLRLVLAGVVTLAIIILLSPSHVI
ncbi:VIT1/CCC1 transporter family protein [Archaeoglobus veneficus]|uniref:VIT family protein n=1 Tax=Archaeoglobus veneficus (strain DSM 11195 / SNP6) TaxID=693661 RepID=F2KSV6_ARCVS|nr:VIT1/CCC1 transporter family protein [Archaeoglobus veneficus]AEA47001.1 protein of unknown function DUF125 transmembrane [Archaeoglobus veneficus SNP6]